MFAYPGQGGVRCVPNLRRPTHACRHMALVARGTPGTDFEGPEGCTRGPGGGVGASLRAGRVDGGGRSASAPPQKTPPALPPTAYLSWGGGTVGPRVRHPAVTRRTTTSVARVARGGVRRPGELPWGTRRRAGTLYLVLGGRIRGSLCTPPRPRARVLAPVRVGVLLDSRFGTPRLRRPYDRGSSWPARGRFRRPGELH